MGERENRLADEIAAKQKEIDALKEKLKEENLNEILKKKSDYTDEEKIKVFDMMYKYVMDILKTRMEDGWTDEDAPEYMFETMMGIVAKDKTRFWKWYSSLGN